ncbi:MAG: amidase [Burkholderiaceae bacterium]
MATDRADERLTATRIVALLRAGEASAEDIARLHLAQIERVEPSVQAFTTFDAEHVLAQARQVDARRSGGAPVGALFGVPVGIKDVFDTADLPTENGTPLQAGRRPHRDSAAVERLRRADAIVLGKTVTTELAYYQPGKTHNPHDPSRTPGGSSSGSAAAVAAGMAPVAIGTQTNGSVIRPAAYCGVYGFKPSHGLISRRGVLQLSRRLDHVGVFAATLDDIALMCDVLAGHDPLDEDTRPRAVPDFVSLAQSEPPMAPRFAFLRSPYWSRADDDTRQAFGELVDALSLPCEEVELPGWADDIERWQAAIMAADMAHNLRQALDHGADRLSERMRDQLARGRQVLAADYLAALEAAERLRQTLSAIFDEYDAIITPATTGVAPRGLDATGDPIFCSLGSFTGLPALSMPLMTGTDDMPLGVQLIGARHDDARLLRSANALMRSLA